MIRKGSVILNNVFGRKTPEPCDSSEKRKNFIEILEDVKKVRKIIGLMVADDKDNYCVKIRFCSAVLQYEAIIGSELENKMKKTLNDLFTNDKSMFKIDSCHKDIIKIKDELIDLFMKDEYILNILNILKDST